MPCQAAMITKFLSARLDDGVEETLKAMKKADVEIIPVIDESGTLAGIFSIKILLENLLPVSVAVGGGANIDIQLSAAPGIARRLAKLYPLRVSDLMSRNFTAINPEAPLWEGVKLLSQAGEPLFVVEARGGKLLGVITGASALEELNRMKDSDI